MEHDAPMILKYILKIFLVSTGVTAKTYVFSVSRMYFSVSVSNSSSNLMISLI